MGEETQIEEAVAEALPVVPVVNSRAAKEIMALPFGGVVKAIMPTTLEEAFRYAQLVVNAGLCPNSYETGGRADPQKVVIGILAGLEVGVPPMQALKGIAIINNRPCIWGDLAVALVQAKGVLLKMEALYTGEPEQDNRTCRVLIYRRGQEYPYVGEFSVKDAKRAGLWANHKKKPWIEYPERMLFNRARAFALRDGFADCLSGLAIAEEVQDMPEAPAIVDSGFLDDAKPALTGPAQEATPANA